jgi:hypothetical protein
MGNVILSPQSLVTVDEALAFLQDQGSPTDDQDMLRHQLNAVTGMILKLTSRDRLVWIAGDEITEYREGYGTNRMFLRNAPIRELVSVTLEPHQTTGISIAVPTPPATFSDACYFEPASAMLVLKNQVFPEGPSTVKVVYEAGYYVQDTPTVGDVADAEVLELKLIALNALARRWSRWKNNRHGVSHESRGEQSVSYFADDLTKDEVRDLRRYRRSLFA